MGKAGRRPLPPSERRDLVLWVRMKKGMVAVVDDMVAKSGAANRSEMLRLAISHYAKHLGSL